MKGFALGFGNILTMVAIFLFFGGLLFSLFEASQTCALTVGKNCYPLIEVLGNATIAPSEQISNSVASLKAVESQSNADLDIYRDFHRQRILVSIMMMLASVFILYKILTFFARSSSFDFGTQMVIILFVLAILALAQILYGYFAFGRLVIPFGGILDLMTNISVVT